MVERQSPLEPEFHVGSHGNFEHGVEILLTETRPGSIVQLAAWPGEEKKLIAAIRTVTGLALPDGAGGGLSDGVKSVFGFAPGKFTVADEAEGLAASFAKAVTPAIGTVTDLSHGRTAIRIAGCFRHTHRGVRSCDECGVTDQNDGSADRAGCLVVENPLYRRAGLRFHRQRELRRKHLPGIGAKSFPAVVRQATTR